MTLLTERYRDKIEGVLSCYDRIVITGTLPQLCYAQGMTGYMYANRIRIFDYPLSLVVSCMQTTRGRLATITMSALKAPESNITWAQSRSKMYDKFKKILRIETTVNNLTFFKHYRTVEHRDRTSSKKFAAMKKNIYSLAPLQKLLVASNRRYLEFISAFDDHSSGQINLNRVSQPVQKSNRKYYGLQFL